MSGAPSAMLRNDLAVDDAIWQVVGWWKRVGKVRGSLPGCKNNEWEFVIIWAQGEPSGAMREREAPFWNPSLVAAAAPLAASCLYHTHLAKSKQRSVFRTWIVPAEITREWQRSRGLVVASRAAWANRTCAVGLVHSRGSLVVPCCLSAVVQRSV